MRILKKWITVVLVAIALGFGSAAGWEKAEAAERLRASWSGASPANSPTWVAIEKGFLKKHGLADLEMVSIESSTTALQALLSGDVNVIVTSVATLVTSRLSGSDVLMIAGMVPTFVDHILVIPEIKNIADLKGKTGAVNRLGSTSDLGLRMALRKYGIDPNKDVKLLGLGNDHVRMAAMGKGQVQFTIISPPFVKEGEKLGLRSLVNIADLKIPFHWNGILAREPTIREKRLFVLNFLKVEIEAIAYIKTHEAETIKILSKYLRLDNPVALKLGYEGYAAVFPKAPYPTPEGVQSLLMDLAGRRPEAAKADPKSFVDMSLIKELEESGFISTLYR